MSPTTAPPQPMTAYVPLDIPVGRYRVLLDAARRSELPLDEFIGLALGVLADVVLEMEHDEPLHANVLREEEQRDGE